MAFSKKDGDKGIQLVKRPARQSNFYRNVRVTFKLDLVSNWALRSFSVAVVCRWATLKIARDWGPWFKSQVWLDLTLSEFIRPRQSIRQWKPGTKAILVWKG